MNPTRTRPRASGAKAAARAIQAFVTSEQRVPSLVEIRRILTMTMGGGTFSAIEGAELGRELQELLRTSASSALQETTELIFHHHSNAFNASPS